MENKCSVLGCGKKETVKGLCKPHYMKKYRYGDPLAKTSRDFNDIEIKEDHAEIILFKSKKAPFARALIDIEDVDKVKNYKWTTQSGGYVVERKRSNGEKLHRLVMGKPAEQIDHKDGNRLDNRKKNLRKATPMQNRQNTPKGKGCKAKYKCVEKLSKGSRWRARITVNKKTLNLGTFATEVDAAMAYDEAAKKYFGEFALLNFPEKGKEYKGQNSRYWNKPEGFNKLNK